MTTGKAMDYTIDGKTYEGYFVAGQAGAPLVVIAHAWGGLKENEQSKAQAIASKLGYNAFAMDVYGKGKRGETQEECEALMNPLAGNRPELQNRLRASLAYASGLDGVDASRVAAIGYCFGGLSVLDMARANMDVLGVCSFHGLFGAPDNTGSDPIKPKVMIQHGWLDPMAQPNDVLMIAEEMGQRKADWQLQAHGHAMHSFTTEGANNPDFGTVYNADADSRSFAALTTFLAELFG